ncbi:hypothetical protein TKK_0009667 [Trichogramma kaykai]
MPVGRDAEKISEVFAAVQYNRTGHPNFMKKLKKYYDKMDLDDFVSEFISNLQIPLTYIEKHAHVENTLQFAAKFIIGLQPPINDENEDEYEEMCPFLQSIFEFLLSHHGSKEVAIRYRVCYFLNMLLDTMGENASIDDDLCNRILQNMMERILDKSPKVRAQAAIALYRLQEPTNKNCPVINVYLFHLAKDPSAEVRRVILAKMAKNKTTLYAAIKRTMDVNDSVRKMAYLFISRITVKSLTISQREKLLNNGLQDTSEIIRKCVREILIPSWLRYYDKNYLNLLKAIDAEHAADTAILALDCLFKNAEIGTLIEQLPIDDTKFVPIDKISSEVVLYWRCLAEFLKKENLTDEFERIMPELSPFCAYIKTYMKSIDDKQSNTYEVITQQFILLQLFEMVKIYDLADEMGRRTLRELILETLQTNYCTEKITECIVQYFETVVPDVNSRVSSLVEVISEIRMPTKINVMVPMSEDERHERKMKRAKLGMQLLEMEDKEYSAIQEKNYALAQEICQNIKVLREEIENLSKEAEVVDLQPSQNVCEEKSDPETMVHCLTIMYSMMQSKTITSLSPTLRTLMDSIALPFMAIQHNNEYVIRLALKCVGLCSLIDKELAKKYFMLYFVYISESNSEEVWVAAAEVIFDLLLKYGFEHFNIAAQEEEDSTTSKKGKAVRLFSEQEEDINVNDKEISCDNGNVNNVLKALMALLDSQLKKLQSVATEGLCKLILHKRISSHSLITQLLILWHNPIAKENTFLSQCLCTFFKLYIEKVPESQSILEEAYLPTLKSLVNAPDLSILQEIDPLRVSEVIINLTCYGISNTYSIHNQLTYTILCEILKIDSEVPIDILVKSLKMLDVHLDGENLKNDVLKALDDVEEKLDNSGEKRLLKYIYEFRNKVNTPGVNVHETSDNSGNLSNPENAEVVEIADENMDQQEEKSDESMKEA